MAATLDTSGPGDMVAALDIGGTKVEAALLDRAGTVLARTRADTPGAAGADAVLSVARDLVQRLVRTRPTQRLRAVGVGSAGVIDPGSGTVLSATDVLAGWTGTDVRGRLSAALGVPVVVRNDVHAHAWGEARHGAGAGHASMLFVAVGTGIGAGFVSTDLVDGILTGAHCAAGHVGHVPSPHAAELPCPCGARGHLEAIAAGPALVREFARRSTTPVRCLQDVAALSAAGDSEATAVLVLGGTAVGAAVGGLVNVLDPDIVVVGGGVAELGATWWDPLREAFEAEALPGLRATPVVASAPDVHAVLRGAADLAWSHGVGEAA